MRKLILASAFVLMSAPAFSQITNDNAGGVDFNADHMQAVISHVMRTNPPSVAVDNVANISTGTSLAPGIDLRQFPAEMNLPQLGYVRVGNRTIVAHRTTRRVVRVITH